jgi:hypothetical protein
MLNAEEKELLLDFLGYVVRMDFHDPQEIEAAVSRLNASLKQLLVSVTKKPDYEAMIRMGKHAFVQSIWDSITHIS